MVDLSHQLCTRLRVYLREYQWDKMGSNGWIHLQLTTTWLQLARLWSHNVPDHRGNVWLGQPLAAPKLHILVIFDMLFPLSCEIPKDSSIGSGSVPHVFFRSDLQSSPKSLWAPTYFLKTLLHGNNWPNWDSCSKVSHPYSSRRAILWTGWLLVSRI